MVPGAVVLPTGCSGATSSPPTRITDQPRVDGRGLMFLVDLVADDVP